MTAEKPKYSNIDMVKIAYIEMLITKRHFRAMDKVVNGGGRNGGHLPKKVYNKRASHKDQAWVAKKTERPRKNKYVIFFEKLLRSQQIYMKAQSDLELLVKKLTPAERESLVTGVQLPHAVLAD